MKVSLDEIKGLREILINHRLEHELLVTRMQVLRRECQELRRKIAFRKASPFPGSLSDGRD